MQETKNFSRNMPLSLSEHEYERFSIYKGVQIHLLCDACKSTLLTATAKETREKKKIHRQRKNFLSM